MNNTLRFALTFAFTLNAFAGTSIEWRDAGTSSPLQSSTISSCGVTKKVDFVVSFAHGMSINGTGGAPNPTCPAAGWIIQNPFRMTVMLFRDGTNIGTKVQQYSSCWFRQTFAGIEATPGNYYATIQFERYKNLKWDVIESPQTSSIAANKAQAIPGLKINGTPASPNVINVDGAYPIVIDGTPTQCASNYFIGAWEALGDWSGTQKYEWGHWFNGAPSNNIKLQQLATTYSYPPSWIKGDPARQGAALAVGRHYVVRLCTGEPAWDCKDALIKVN